MDISHPDYTFQARSSSPRNISNSLQTVFFMDPELQVQLFFIIPVIAGGIILNLSAIQWFLVILVSALFIGAGICRTASMLQVKRDPSLTPFHVTRIKAMGNALLTITAGISLFTYLLVFVPKIIELL
jgi:diacylglycerol kinase